jgi:hypothetical protein
MFQLAWDEKGMVFNLENVPDEILKLLVYWRNEKIQEENERAKNPQR